MFKQRKTIIAESERLILRLPLKRDFEEWVALRRDAQEEFRQIEPQWRRNHLTYSNFKQRVTFSKKIYQERRAIPVFIEKRKDNHLLGSIYVENIRKMPHASAEIGYWMGLLYRRQGLMYEALEAIITSLFKDEELSRLAALALPHNHASIALLEKLGFEREGLLKTVLEVNGQWADHFLYSLLRDDRFNGANAQKSPYIRS